MPVFLHVLGGCGCFDCVCSPHLMPASGGVGEGWRSSSVCLALSPVHLFAPVPGSLCPLASREFSRCGSLAGDKIELFVRLVTPLQVPERRLAHSPG